MKIELLKIGNIFCLKFVSEIFQLTSNYVRDRICLTMYCEICEFIR